MYKISVPLYNANIKRNDRERALRELKRFGTERVFLALDKYELDENKRRLALDELTDNCKFFKENGYEVGAWIWAFMLSGNTEYRNIRTVKGTELTGNMCPSDESFTRFAADYAKDIAKCGVDLMMLDDDFRFGFLGESPACLCDGHIDAINRITGEIHTREELEVHILNGGPNIYRDAWLKANGDSMRSFSAALRKAVDEVNPSIRLGACACLTSWDIDGTDAYEIARILAGNTKPFVRLIGAPYWAYNRTWGNLLQDVVELERMETAWTRLGDIEVIAEGDVFPRPRSTCPASYLEGFDTAIRASGCTNGILKYGIDYHSNADYETGYAKYHELNSSLYSAIDRIFTGKTSCGVRVYESMKKAADTVCSTKVNDYTNLENQFFSKAARTLAFNTIPTVYEGNGVCGIVFDENARSLPVEALKNGLIIDLAAAEILTERGIDVGLVRIGKQTGGTTERLLYNNNHVYTRGAVINEIEVNENAEILSTVDTPDGDIPFSYRYENADGNRFLVLNINTRIGSDNLLKHFERSKQYAEAAEWLGGNKLPATVYGHPSLYIQCKKGTDGSMAVGLWNFFEDSAFEPIVKLDGKYREIEFANCTARLEGDKVYLSDIPPFGCAIFEVKK